MTTPAPARSFAELDAAVQASVGARLFTVLHWDPDSRTLTRLHSDHPQEYPVGGTKSVEVAGDWLRTCIDHGRPWWGRDPAAVAEVFADHELIASLGCGSILNAPVRHGGFVVGILNALGREGAYDDGSLARLVAVADTAGDLVARHAPGGAS